MNRPGEPYCVSGGVFVSNGKRRIVVSLPEAMIREVDGIVADGKSSRSQVIHAAMQLYLEELRRRQLRDRLRAGYEDMAALNLALAEEALSAENEILAYDTRSVEGQ